MRGRVGSIVVTRLTSSYYGMKPDTQLPPKLMILLWKVSPNERFTINVSLADNCVYLVQSCDCMVLIKPQI